MAAAVFQVLDLVVRNQALPKAMRGANRGVAHPPTPPDDTKMTDRYVEDGASTQTCTQMGHHW